MSDRDDVASTAIDSRILSVRGQSVILDADLARLYGVSTGALNQAVKRNTKRFPRDFAFRLSREETSSLTSQSVISMTARGGRRSPPWAFTEHGAIMAASVLRSPRAVEMSLFVVRAFVRLRDLTRNQTEIWAKLDALERQVATHDADLSALFAAVRKLLAAPPRSVRPIGFGVERS